MVIKDSSATDSAVKKATIPSSRRGLKRKAGILEAATALFLENGYGETSVNMIIARSGGSKSTFYSYFPTKEALLRAVVDIIVSNRKEPEFQTSEDFRAALVTFAEQRLQVVFSQHHRALLRLIIAERERFPDIALMYFERGPKRSHELLAEFMQGMQERGRLISDNAEESAEFFIGMLLHQWYTGQLFLQSTPPSVSDIRHRADHVVGCFFAAFCTAVESD